MVLEVVVSFLKAVDLVQQGLFAGNETTFCLFLSTIMSDFTTYCSSADAHG